MTTAVARLDPDRARLAIARAIDLSLRRDDFRIVHLGMHLGARATRLELVVEAADRLSLARGMQGFQVSAARALNRLARRTGPVFPDRYRAHILPTRRTVAAAIARLPAGRRIGSGESLLLS